MTYENVIFKNPNTTLIDATLIDATLENHKRNTIDIILSIYKIFLIMVSESRKCSEDNEQFMFKFFLETRKLFKTLKNLNKC